MEAQDDQKIYIVGPLIAQNEGLGALLEREIGYECETLENIQDVPVSYNPKLGIPKTVLMDCFGLTSDDCLVTVQEDGRKVISQNYVALFNLLPNQGVEETAVSYGVRGFFYTNHPLETIYKGVRAIINGDYWVNRKVLNNVIQKNTYNNGVSSKYSHNLTQRELEILEMLIAGYPNMDIADKLYISPYTVKTHLYNIYKKIGVHHRFQAALWGAKNL